MNNKQDSKQYLFDKPHNVKRLLVGFYICCALLVVLDFIVHRHIYTEIENIPAFYALYGFGACVILVLMAKVLRKIVMRDENYYQDFIENKSDKRDVDY